MKILEIVHGFPPSAQGGAEIYTHAHARELTERYGDEILVLTREQDPTRPEFELRTEHRDRLRIVWVNNTFRNARTFEDTYRNETIGDLANSVIGEFRPDVAHIHHLTCLSTTIVRLLAERRIPCFLTLHDYWFICHRGQLLDVDYRVCEGPGRDNRSACGSCLGPAGGAGRVGFIGATMLRTLARGLPPASVSRLRRTANRLGAMVMSVGEAEDQARRRLDHMREVLAEVTHFIAPSRHMRDRFVQFGVAADRITVAGYGFDHVPFRQIDRRASNHLRLGFLGSLMVSKAPHVLLEAIGRLPGGSVSVDLFGAYCPYHGDDGYRQKLEPLLNRDDVRVHGAIAHDRVAEAFASIDVLVVPSIWPENSPLVIQEAFLAGVPVVASRIGGIPEVVDEGRNGLLFRAGDAADLARVIMRLLNEPELLDALRADFPSVRTIEDDVRFTRSIYETHLSMASRKASVTASVSRIAAIVLNFGTPDDTLLAVKSLLASRRPLDDIIVVDNDSGDPARGARDALNDVWPRITYLQTGSNLGFSGGMNVGIREALARGADRIVLVNSDVVVPPDSIQRLDQSLGAVADAGIAGPVVLARSEPDRIASLGVSYKAFSGRMRHLGFGARVGEQALPAWSRVDGVSGCLMVVKRDVFEAIGLLDEDFFFGFEDLDLCLRARRAGFATLLAGTATVYHEGGRSIGAASPRRLYFAARNHLLMARRAGPSIGRFAVLLRSVSIVVLNLAHAVRASGGVLPARLGAVVHGTRDYLAGRFGAGVSGRFGGGS